MNAVEQFQIRTLPIPPVVAQFDGVATLALCLALAPALKRKRREQEHEQDKE